MISFELFPKWPYDQALTWMKDAHARIFAEPDKVIVGIGSHQESVITLGKNPITSIIHQQKLIERPDVIIRAIDRGGGATVHEFGQIVLYPILNIKSARLSARDLSCILEKTMISFLARYAVLGTRGEGSPGIFVGQEKIGFVGLRIKDNISSHGMALNVFNEGILFKAIDPCGISDLLVTSLFRQASLNEKLDQLLLKMSEDFKTNFYSMIASYSRCPA